MWRLAYTSLSRLWCNDIVSDQSKQEEKQEETTAIVMFSLFLPWDHYRAALRPSYDPSA